MGWQTVLILFCTHLGVLGLGCWIGEKSKRAYKRKLYAKLYGGQAHSSQFLNLRRHIQ